MLPIERFMTAEAAARVSFFGGHAFVPPEPARVTRKAPSPGEALAAAGPASPDVPGAALHAGSSSRVSEPPPEKALAAALRTSEDERPEG